MTHPRAHPYGTPHHERMVIALRLLSEIPWVGAAVPEDGAVGADVIVHGDGDEVPGAQLTRVAPTWKSPSWQPHMKKALAPMKVTLCGMVAEVRPVFWWKAVAPMKMTLFGMVTEVRPHWLKAPSPMKVTVFEMATKVRLVLWWKAPLPMDLTPVGMVTEVRLRHRPKALWPMDVTLFGMATEVRLVHW